MLTPQKQRILDFIRAYRLRHGISPTLQDIADALEIRHRGSVSKHLSALVEKGYLVKPSRGWRGFRLVEDAPDDRFCLPLVGTIAAGRPIEAIAGQDQLDLYDYLLGGCPRIENLLRKSPCGTGQKRSLRFRGSK